MTDPKVWERSSHLRRTHTQLNDKSSRASRSRGGEPCFLLLCGEEHCPRRGKRREIPPRSVFS